MVYLLYLEPFLDFIFLNSFILLCFIMADKIELTKVYSEFNGDAFFPEIPLDIFELINEERFDSNSENEFDYAFLTYKKR